MFLQRGLQQTMAGVRRVPHQCVAYASDAECPVCRATTNQTIVLSDNTPLQRGHVHENRLVLANLLRCNVCTLKYFHPRPAPAVIARHYGVNVLAGVRDEGDFLRSLHSETIVRRVRAMLDEIERHTLKPGEIPNGRRMIDVGCLFGTLVAEARRCGYAAHGIEPDPVISEHLRKHVGEPIHTTYLDAFAGSTDLRFSLITMVDTLEHHMDPKESLRLAASLLEPGGHLYVEVPNVESVSAEYSLTEYRYLEFPGHLNYFTAAALRHGLEAAGFELVMSTTQTHSWEMPMTEHILRQQGQSFEDQMLQDELIRNNRHEGLAVLARYGAA